MVFLLDFIVVLIVGCTMFFVIKKGFIKSLMDLLSIVCSIILAKMFASQVSEIYYKIIYSHVSPKIESSIAKLTQSDKLPDMINFENLSDMISKYGLNFVSKEDTSEFISNSITATLSYLLAYLSIFIVVMVAFKILTPLVCMIFKLPVLKTANTLLSVVFGVVMSALYLLLFISIMQVLIPSLCSLYPDDINSEVIEKTYLFSYLYKIEWLKFFVN